MVNEVGEIAFRIGCMTMTIDLLQPAVSGGFFWYVAVAISIVILVTFTVLAVRFMARPFRRKKKGNSSSEDDGCI